jgi:hypothetical protein
VTVRRRRRWPWVVGAVAIVAVVAAFGVERAIRTQVRGDLCRDDRALVLSWQLLPHDSASFPGWYETNNRLVATLRHDAGIDPSTDAAVRAPALRVAADWADATNTAAPISYQIDLATLNRACGT